MHYRDRAVALERREGESYTLKTKGISSIDQLNACIHRPRPNRVCVLFAPVRFVTRSIGEEQELQGRLLSTAAPPFSPSPSYPRCFTNTKNLADASLFGVHYCINGDFLSFSPPPLHRPPRHATACHAALDRAHSQVGHPLHEEAESNGRIGACHKTIDLSERTRTVASTTYLHT